MSAEGEDNYASERVEGCARSMIIGRAPEDARLLAA
jgi:hypothetical protein